MPDSIPNPNRLLAYATIGEAPQRNEEDIGLKQFTNFFAMVGYAITRWAHLDACLFDLFLFGLGAPKEKAAALYYGAPTINLHLTLTDRVMQLSLPQKHRRTWKTIWKDADKLLKFRNHLAHEPPRFTRHEDPTMADLLQGRLPRRRGDPWEIATAQTKLLVKSEPQKARFAEIAAHAQSVDKLIDRMEALRKMLPLRARKQRAVRPRPKPPPKKARRRSKRSTSAKQRRQPRS